MIFHNYAVIVMTSVIWYPSKYSSVYIQKQKEKKRCETCWILTKQEFPLEVINTAFLQSVFLGKAFVEIISQKSSIYIISYRKH